MKVIVAGAFGNLGGEILRALVNEGHEVIAADLKERKIDGLEGKYKFVQIDATNHSTMKGICDGCDIAITTMGLTGASKSFTAYDIDYKGNLNFYNECVKAKIKKFNYISVISCDEKGAEKVPMLHAKYMLEQKIKKGSIDYVIYRPTGYFYDIAKVFKPYVDKGEMQLLKGYGDVQANVVNCPDFANYIANHMMDSCKTYNVGGKETYSYEEMAKMCFDAANKPLKIKWAPIWMFSILANLPKIKKEGKHDIILFSKWTLSHNLVGDVKIGTSSFKKYINSYFSEGAK